MQKPKIAGEYGIDAPYVPVLSGVGAIALVAYSFVQVGFTRSISLALAALLFAQVASYMYTTTRGKFAVWQSICDQLAEPRDGRILDVGCGRGMVVITALCEWPAATAVGIDLWRSRDQTGNDPAATTRNATLNGVADRLELLTQDMAELNVGSDAFDYVFANVAIQNVKDRDARRKTIEGMYAATRPGGEIRIVDIQYVKQYADDLRACGAVDVTVRSLGPKGWFGNPGYASRLVSARKP
jgi:SAM-dependent methyltransferase